MPRAIHPLTCGLLGASVITSVASALPQDFVYGVGGYINSQNGDGFGSSVVFLGDVDGDQLDDFAVGAPGHLSNHGRVFLHSGHTGALLRVWMGGPGERLGSSLVAIEDLDGDGLRELVIGAYGATPVGGPAQAGKVVIVSGATGLVLREIAGTTAGAGAGFACATIADLDGDMVEDLLIGHAFGRVRVHSGATGALIRQHVGPAAAAERYGWAVAALGDVDIDGATDYAIGAPSVAGISGGRVEVFSGATGNMLWSSDGGQGDEFGRALAGLGDLDGDQLPDLLVGATGADHPAVTYGSAWILSGATGSRFRRIDGVDDNGGSGAAVAALGDLDGDGREEYAVAAPRARFYLPHLRTGTVHAYDGATGSVLFVLSGVHDSDSFGAAIAVGGDLDGDGRSDLVIGASTMRHHGIGGNVRVHAGACTGAVRNYCVAKVNSLGCTPRLVATGSSSWSGGDDFTVRALDVLPGTLGFYYCGLEDRQRLTVAGFVCIESGFRSPVIVSTAGGSGTCTGVLELRFDSSYLSSQGIGPGARLHVQAWYRDPNHPDGRGVGLSDGLGFTVCP